MFNSHISNSAFLVNESRFRSREVSKDTYAKLWQSNPQQQGIEKLWNDFSREVYPHDDRALAIRNRFFLENLEAFIDRNKSGYFVNIGAGFTSYPYLTSTPLKSLEIDLPHVISYKEKAASTLLQEGKLPQRKVSYLGADINKEPEKLIDFIAKETRGKNSFILMEGVTYYIKRSNLMGFLKNLCSLQQSGSSLAFDFWKPDIADHPVFQNLQSFFEKKLGFPKTNYTFLSTKEVEDLEGYMPHVITNVVQEEKIYYKNPVLHSGNALMENYALLVRK